LVHIIGYRSKYSLRIDKHLFGWLALAFVEFSVVFFLCCCFYGATQSPAASQPIRGV